MTAELFSQLLLLLLLCNGAPILAARLFRSVADLPVDLNRHWRDGRAVLGPSKTWRGVVIAVLSGGGLAWVFELGLVFGLVFGALAMAGDLLSSFLKRRNGLGASARSRGLDQIPESLLPAIYACHYLDLSWWWAPLLSAAFTVAQIVISRPLYLLRIRKRPY